MEQPAKLGLKIDGNKIFAPLKNKWLILTPEERVRQGFVCRLVNEYGYDLKQMEQEVQVSNSKRGQGKARADIVIWKNEADKKAKKSAFIVVECKAANVKIQREDYYQGLNYATWAKAQFFVTTNEKEDKCFKVLQDKIPDELSEIGGIPKAEDINNEKAIKRLLEQTKAFTRDDFQRLLFACHNVIRNNDKLSPEMAFDEISKILFMKIRFERKERSGVVFSQQEFLMLKKGREKYAPPDSLPFYQELFEDTKKEFANDEIFVLTDTLRIRENSFLEIVKLLERYNLSDTSDDVKGIAFEEFLGKTFRGDLGQFFTPRTIVNFMVAALDPKETEIICDPCCGTGGFLIGAFEYVRSAIEHHIQHTKDHIRQEFLGTNFDELSDDEQERRTALINTVFAELNTDLDPANAHGRLYDLSYRRIFGTDAEPRSARTAKMNMIMHGDGHGGVHHHDGLLNVNGIFENRFDVILTNPPFGANVAKSLEITEADRYTDAGKIKYYTERYGEAYTDALKQITENIGKPVLSLFDIGDKTTLTECLFIERCLRLLKEGGRMGIVLPEGFLNNPDAQNIREYVEGKAKIVLIVSLPQDVFKSAKATVKPSIVFLKKFTEQEERHYAQTLAAVIQEVEARFVPEIQEVQERIKTIKATKPVNKDAKKQVESELKALETRKEAAVKQELKARLDYDIPMVQVEKAGISSTGAPNENELEDVLREFTAYRKATTLWEETAEPVEYSFANEKLVRVVRHR
jgi:type I restriction enzyme M protein